jgi:hypothetical protein
LKNDFFSEVKTFQDEVCSLQQGKKYLPVFNGIYWKKA